MSDLRDVTVLGGGPGGYVAALRAAQLGARVALVEEETVGGVCLNVGCVPTKALLRSAEIYRTIQKADAYGLRLEGEVSPDWTAIQTRKAHIVRRLVGSVETLLQRAGVKVIRGRGRLVGPQALEVATGDSTQKVMTRNLIVATGSRPIRLSLPGIGLPGVLDSTGALTLDTLPNRLLVVGGGVVGVEFASIFSAFGVQVTLVELLDRLLPQMDADLGPALAWLLAQRGVDVRPDSRIERIEQTDGGLVASIVTPDGEVMIEADRVLIAVGRQPNIENIGLDVAGVRAGLDGVPVNDRMETNVSGIYAIGDVTGGPLLAHVAMRGGEIAAENSLGHVAALDLKTVPWCVYTDPEVASVGLTEAQAHERGYNVKVGRFPLSANARALTHGEAEGFVKIVSEGRFDEVLGLHIVGPQASELIHEGGIVLALEATLDEIVSTPHAHPTLGEAMREAALDAQGGAIHK